MTTVDQRAWETAMGMRGYSGSPAAREDREQLDLRIENVIGGLRNYGYRVLSEPLPGRKQEWYEQLREGLWSVDETVEYLHKHAHCRGRSKRTLRLLHDRLPEPCWGVRA